MKPRAASFEPGPMTGKYDGLRQRLNALEAVSRDTQTTTHQTFIIVGDVHVEMARNRPDLGLDPSQI